VRRVSPYWGVQFGFERDGGRPAPPGVRLGRNYSGNFFEDFWLSAQLRQWWREPELSEAVAARAARLGNGRWLRDLQRDGASMVGAKHPLLCLGGYDFQEAWGAETKFIWAYRPLEQSISSLERRGWWPGRERRSKSDCGMPSRNSSGTRRI